MKITSINVGKPKNVSWNNQTIATSIFKEAIDGPTAVSFLDVAGNGQADLRYHGGKFKALYSYDQAYYRLWQQKLSRTDWKFGMFGEVLTTEGLTDDLIQVGNIYQAGSVVFQALQPRIPCFKLNLRFNNKRMLADFYNFKCYGTYYQVLEEGYFEAGDSITLIQKSTYNFSIQDLVECYYSKGKDQNLLQEILNCGLIPKDFTNALKKFDKQS